MVPLSARDTSTCTPSNDCPESRSTSDDCGDACHGCTAPVSTFFRPRSISGDLTYRNSNTFYIRHHENPCTFFTFDSTLLYQQNRRGTCIGLGFFGKNPIDVAELEPDVYSVNLGLGSELPSGFLSHVRFSPKRRVFGWLPQFLFNLNCIHTGLWADFQFAVLQVHHETCLDEKIPTLGEINGITTVQEALDTLRIFPDEHREVGVDDIEVRLGYDYSRCGSDSIGIYIVGSIPTAKHKDNSRWFQPLIGSHHWGIGVGITADYTFYNDTTSLRSLLLMSDLKYIHKFRAKEKRMFDLKNGPLSRFLLVVPEEEDDRMLPESATKFLRHCVKVNPRSTLDWWLALRYNWCNWGFEGAYNFFWRQKECVSRPRVNFRTRGIFDMTRCMNLTSHSTAIISDVFGEGTPDATFVELTSADVAVNSAAAREARSHTFSGTLCYSDSWCNYDVSVAIGARYELADRHRQTSTLENWGVFGKASISL